MLMLLVFPQDLEIGGVPYEKLATRALTEERMLSQIQPNLGVWGDWHRLTAFNFPGFNAGALELVHPVEAELAHMGPTAAGPNLGATYVGKQDSPVAWENIGRQFGTLIDMHSGDNPALQDNVTGYVYASVESEKAGWIDVNCGSDDGLRLWWNGEIVVDADVPRSLSTDAHQLRLPLYKGTNHMLAKIIEGGGDWAFFLGSSDRLAPAVEAALYDQLDTDFPTAPDRAAYAITTIPVPIDGVIEVGGLDFFADGTPVVATRRGDVWRILNAYEEPASNARYELFATGLHEPLGLAVRNERGREVVYVVQRGELTRLVDTNGDFKADRYEAVCNEWGVSGNYHEFAFGPVFDDEGNAVVTLNVGFCGSLGKAIVPYRGWCVKIAPDGTMTPWCDGLRSPNGIGKLGNEMFYVDNQGDYVATCRLSHLARESWHGHPASLRWRDDIDSGRPPRQPASVWFPYGKMGQSSADIATCTRAGFGPFEGQLFVGDQTLSSVARVCLEEVEGFWQGACFPFLDKLQSGVNRVAFAPDGSMFVGQTDRGWGSVGRTSFGVQHVRFKGETPFEMREVRVTERGFEIEFTQPPAPGPDQDPHSYFIESWTYPYISNYGAPEVERKTHRITGSGSAGPNTISLQLDELREGFVYAITAEGVRSEAGAPLVHPTAYYTLQRVPGRDYAKHDVPRVLFLTHSADFVHDVVKRPDPAVLAHAEERLVEAAGDRFEIVASQDCSLIAADRLREWDAIVFYTTGELPVADSDRSALLDWVRAGGAFIGVHCATDTFYDYKPYQEMLGGVFDGHPWHEDVRLLTDGSGHPALTNLADAFDLKDEIYQFRDLQRPSVHELIRLANESVEVGLGKRADQSYALSWCKPYGRGRVFYTALGHREEVWDDERFTDHLLDGIGWALDGPDTSVPAPEGASLLTGGDSAGWVTSDGAASGWRADNGQLEVVAGAGNARSSDEFGDAWIHVEFQVPRTPEGTEWQARGNSGIYVQGRYEVQVLDSLHSDPYQIGDAGAIYGVAVPEINACREADRWQSFDIEFTAPRFAADGAKTESARMSVWQNGVPIHRDVEIAGPTGSSLAGEVARGPLMLQEHGSPVSYRNIWVQAR